MSLIPLMLGEYNISADYASWLASVFYGGLLVGAMFIERVVRQVGHRKAFIGCLAAFSLTIVTLPVFANGLVWLAARFIAGIAVAGVGGAALGGEIRRTTADVADTPIGDAVEDKEALEAGINLKTAVVRLAKRGK